MFLFEGDFGRVMHTGDFRLEALGDGDARSALPEAVTRAPVDELWLDDTYLRSGAEFPARVVVLSAMQQVALQHVRSFEAGRQQRGSAASRAVVYVGVDSLGKEELLMALATVLGVPAEVDARRLVAARALGLPAQLIGGPSGTGVGQSGVDGSVRLVVVSRREMQGASGVGLVAKAREAGVRAVGLLPTGFAHREIAGRGRRAGVLAGSEDAPGGAGGSEGGASWPNLCVPHPSAADAHVYSFPYSLHSPMAELRTFVSAVAPARVRSVTHDGVCITGNFAAELGRAPGAPWADGSLVLGLKTIAPPRERQRAAERDLAERPRTYEAARVAAKAVLESRPRAVRPRAPGKLLPTSPGPRKRERDADDETLPHVSASVGAHARGAGARAVSVQAPADSNGEPAEEPKYRPNTGADERASQRARGEPVQDRGARYMPPVCALPGSPAGKAELASGACTMARDGAAYVPPVCSGRAKIEEGRCAATNHGQPPAQRARVAGHFSGNVGARSQAVDRSGAMPARARAQQERARLARKSRVAMRSALALLGEARGAVRRRELAAADSAAQGPQMQHAAVSTARGTELVAPAGLLVSSSQ